MNTTQLAVAEPEGRAVAPVTPMELLQRGWPRGLKRRFAGLATRFS